VTGVDLGITNGGERDIIKNSTYKIIFIKKKRSITTKVERDGSGLLKRLAFLDPRLSCEIVNDRYIDI